MNKNSRGIATASFVFAALFLVVATTTLSPVYGSTVTLSGFLVTPSQAPRGAMVTGTVTIQNLDTKAVSVVVTFFDGGVQVADNSANPVLVPSMGTDTLQLSFNTVADAPHCYAATANPGAAIVGYCETGGHVLGGASVPMQTMALIATSLAVASVAAAGVVLTLRRRRTA